MQTARQDRDKYRFILLLGSVGVLLSGTYLTYLLAYESKETTSGDKGAYRSKKLNIIEENTTAPSNFAEF